MQIARLNKFGNSHTWNVGNLIECLVHLTLRAGRGKWLQFEFWAMRPEEGVVSVNRRLRICAEA
jgi:hypothetical protein